MTVSAFATASRVPAARSIASETRAHGLRVGTLAGRIAEALGMTPVACSRLAAAAVPHDHGKTTIPPGILLWPGPLDEEQLEIMRGHAIAGERLARRFPGDYGLLAGAIARSHHERFDGRGYPDGLSGDAIPIAVAIVTVADVFDALTSDRPYRPAFSSGEALAIMRHERGRQFVPSVLDAFLAAVGPHASAHPPTLELAPPPEPPLPAGAFRYRQAEPGRTLAS